MTLKFSLEMQEIMMPSLQEVYARAVERNGAESRSAKMIKLQMEALEKPSSAERLFVGGGMPMDTTKE